MKWFGDNRGEKRYFDDDISEMMNKAETIGLALGDPESSEMTLAELDRLVNVIQ